MEDPQKKSLRLLLLHKMFNERSTGYRTSELAQHLGVTERTIERDLIELQASPWNLPLVRENWLWHLESSRAIPLPPITLVREEAAALFIGARLLSQHSGRLDSLASSAITKLAQALPADIGRFLLVSSGTKPFIDTALIPEKEKATRDVFEALVTGWVERRKVVCTHQTLKGGIKTYRIAPYTFEPSAVGHAIYVRGLCDEDQPKHFVRTLKLDRIRKAELTTESFQHDKNYTELDLATAWRIWNSAEEPIEVRLRFNRSVADRVKETRWHPNQRIIDLAQGGCEWVAEVAEPKEMLPWIRGWGAACEVLAPQEVRDLIVREATNLAQLYQIFPKNSEKLGQTSLKHQEQNTKSGYAAHSINYKFIRHDLVEHLEGVGKKAQVFANSFGAGSLAYYCGLWHDLGKFNPEWQAYLLACEAGQKPTTIIDHKAAGSLLAFQQGLEGVSLLIQAHHGGLQDRQTWIEWLHMKQNDPATHEAIQKAQQILPNLLPALPPTQPNWLNQGQGTNLLTLEFFMRILFSALVDADFLDTEAHFNTTKTTQRQQIQPIDSLWSVFEQNHATFVEEAQIVGSPAVNNLRQQIYAECLAGASRQPGLFRLDVPTGGGKTRSVMAFALHHAKQHDLRRVIVALPFTSITEQTAGVYRNIFEAGQPAQVGSVVLEHHSATTEPEEKGQANLLGGFRPNQVWQRLAAENWDAPIVVTTTVQLFESLFSNQTSKCRKLHRLAKSVIVLDEVQTLPPHLLEPILSAIKELTAHYGASVVFSTATQPAFEQITAFRDINASPLISNPAYYFDSLKRVNYEWQMDTPWNWLEVAAQMQSHSQTLAIVNTKKDALKLYKTLNDPTAFYLSTELCSLHRQEVITQVQTRLQQGLPCRLVSTQVVEAGVDLDFELVLRALAPLDSLIQAAGRCNRNGSQPQPGRVIIFRTEEGNLPASDYYRTATNLTRTLYGEGLRDLNAPDATAEYYRRLFRSLDTDEAGINPQRTDLNYPEVAKRFKMINQPTESVIVRYGNQQQLDHLDNLLEQLQSSSPLGLRQLRRQLQPYTVAIRTDKIAKYNREKMLKPLVAGLYLWTENYHKKYGLAGEDLDPESLVV